jgi:3-oxoacyl-[acyl-carrier-protein] synthase-1
MGMVSSVGRHASAACAAIRAQLSRPRRCAYYQSLEEDTQEPSAVMGHPVQGYAEGFNGVGLWMRLTLGSVADLLGSAGLPSPGDQGFWRRTRLLAVMPSPVGPRFQLDEGDVSLLEESFLQPLLGRLRLPLAGGAAAIAGTDHAGTAAAVREAERLFSQGLADRVILLAVDSYLDPLTLQWLDADQRLKTADRPTGLMPGEAAVSLLLESSGSARRRDAAVLARVAAAAVAREPHPLTSGETNTGLGLSTCLVEALDAAGLSGRYSGDIVSDLNGESWRAQEWGTVIVRLIDRLESPRLHMPCVSTGDTGAASGALGMCLAIHLLSRGHSRTGRVLVTSSSASGETGCVALGSAAS